MTLNKIDTGADVSAIPEFVFKQLQDVSFTHSDHRLTGPIQHQLQVAGQFTATLNCHVQSLRSICMHITELQVLLTLTMVTGVLTLVTDIKY